MVVVVIVVLLVLMVVVLAMVVQPPWQGKQTPKSPDWRKPDFALKLNQAVDVPYWRLYVS